VLADHRNVDMLVNNAGRSIRRSVALSYDRFHDYERTIQLNYLGAVRLILALLPSMRAHKSGHIINISSMASQAPPPGGSVYSATKGAVDTLVKHLAAALGPRGIRVNAVAPGVVATDMSNFAKTDAGRDYVLGLQTFRRLAAPEDIADVVAFLASRDARWINGETVHVDGGSKL